MRCDLFEADLSKRVLSSIYCLLIHVEKTQVL